MATKPTVPHPIVRQVAASMGDAMNALEKLQALYEAIARLSTDSTIKKLCETGNDIASHHWACLDSDATEARHYMGASNV